MRGVRGRPALRSLFVGQMWRSLSASNVVKRERQTQTVCFEGGRQMREQTEVEVLAEWLIQAERELRRAQKALDEGRRFSNARFASARAEVDLALYATECWLSFDAKRRILPNAQVSCLRS